MKTKEKLFVDTGAWIALINSEDQYHQPAVDFYRLLEPFVQRVTSSHVISETYTWLRYKAGFLFASNYLSIIQQALTNDSLTVIRDNKELLEFAEHLLRDFPDQKISYVDAISMAIMRKEGITNVFGFDHHFYLMNFQIIPNGN